MNALFLPGNSPRHAEWIEEMKAALSSQFETVKTQHYRHWQSGKKGADVEYEINVAKELANSLKPYTIIGKSIGTVIAAKGCSDGILDPEKLILLGVSINGGASSELFGQWLSNIKIPIVIVQNANDPLGSFSDVKASFEDTGSHLSFVGLPGDTHDYLNFEAIAKLI